MANPRQRRKTRSSSYKPVKSTNAKNLRKKPAIRGPKVLQKAWDKTKTVRQNYAALGLLADPNAALNTSQMSETDEPQASTSASSISGSSTLPSAAAGGQSSSSLGPSSAVSSTRAQMQPKPASSTPIPKGHGRLIRDPQGNIIGVEIPDDESINNEGDDADELQRGGDRSILAADDLDRQMQSDNSPRAGSSPWGQPMLGDRPVLPVHAKTPVAQELEAMAAAGAGPKPMRAASSHQVKWLQELVAAHGDDVDAMVRDRRLNVWQKTRGEIRRALKSAGGSTALRGMGA
ncbi:hypothetical protein DL93DRAFT_2086564 [Clavulina sp. PMI_390]|nr:hypothetical protein DL93DRAFT_2086564 [Clavulina sp. PMI_390]